MAKYAVTVIVTYTGEIYVEADSKDAAVAAAQKKYDGPSSLMAPCIDVDWPDADDLDGGGIEIVDEEDDES